MTSSVPFAALATAIAWLGGAIPAMAAPLGAGEVRARVAGAELRGYFRDGIYLEDHIWRFAPDGGARATYTRSRGSSNMNGITESGSDAGTWAVEGDRLCVQFRIVLRGQKQCYTIDAGNGDQVRLVGPVSITGTLSR